MIQYLEQAQDDGTILAIREMERAGIDIVTDGEIRRESYSNRFALALEGIDADQPGEVRSQSRPRDTGAARRGEDPSAWTRGGARYRIPAAQRQHATKITLPGPFTMTQQARNDFYQDEEELAMDYAVAVNEELRALKACGVDVVQLDEPWVRAAPDKAARYAAQGHQSGAWRELMVPRSFIFASATLRWSPISRVVTASCRNSRIRSRIKFRSRPPNRGWTSAFCVTSRARKSCWG